MTSLLLRPTAGIKRVFAVLALESEPVDPGLPGLQPLRRDGEPCLFTEQVTKLVVQPGTLALRFLRQPSRPRVASIISKTG